MKKEDIFKTTLALIASQGLHATPMSQIAKESGAAVGTIYHHFKSKEELVQMLYAEIHKELEEIAQSDEVDVKNYKIEFTALFLRVFKFLIQNPPKFYFLQQYENSPFGSPEGALKAHVEYPLKPDFFRLGREHKLIKQTSLSLITNIFYSNITNLVRLYFSENIALDKEILQLVIDGCWGMLKR
jgi:TetR/AcrR family transcriptional repressor of multidrug resistance operon